MYIHFIFMEYKETKTEYLVTIKDESKDLTSNYINNLIYNNLIYNKLIKGENNNNNNNNLGINYFSIFYIKKGIIIENNDLWKKLFNIYISEIKLIYLIDSNYINNLLNNNIILFNLNSYKNKIYPIIIDQYNI